MKPHIEFSFILVEPQRPANIGAAARAIKTMGFTDLRLVQPSDRGSEQATWLAHGAQDVLEGARNYQSFEEATSTLDYLVATTGRRRKWERPWISVRELRSHLEKMAAPKVGIVFGPESTGLTNNHLMNCDLWSYIPTKIEHPSLNLAQAVQVFAYELSLSPITARQVSTPQSLPHAKKVLPPFMERLGIYPDTQLFHKAMGKVNLLSADDLEVLLSLKHQIDKALNAQI